MELKGKTAIVTGSGRGLGEGIALAFAREGANVVVSDRNGQDASAVAGKIRSLGGSAIAVTADVTRKDQIDAMVAETLRQFRTIDVLVNNAGIESTPRQLKDISEEQWDRVIGVNLKGVFLCCKAVIPIMIEHGGGRIINISSLAGKRMSFFGSADYTASKHGVAGLTDHLAWELAEYHINVNAINPGAILTPLAEKTTTPEYRDMVTKRLIPLGRWLTTDEVAQAAVFLASDRSAMITGQQLDVDGGVMTGYGEDLRGVIKKRMTDLKAKESHT